MRMLAPLRVHMSMARVLESAQIYGRVDETAVGRLAATRGAGALPDDVVRKVQGTMHPLVRTHPVSGEKSLYCDSSYAVGIEGLTSGGRGAAEIPRRAHDPARLHLPAALGAEDLRAVGQPDLHPPGLQRL